MIKVEFLNKKGSFHTPGTVREVDMTIAEKLVKGGFAKYVDGKRKEPTKKSGAVPGEIKMSEVKSNK